MSGKCASSALPKELKATDPGLQANYERFKEEVTKKALQVLQEIIPRKMKEFDDVMPISAEPMSLMNVQDFPADDEMYRIPNIILLSEKDACVKNENGKRLRTESVETQPGVVMKLPEYIYDAKALSNSVIMKRIERMKTESAELLELVASVKLWIQLNIPRIEDGNNFGVAIQEDVIHELSRVEEAAFNLRDSASKYFLQRAKLITKIIKYPNVEDYRNTLKELDEKQWFQMKVTDMDTRNNYAIIYDMLYKNWHKVVRPRTTDGSMMVY
ncbi:proteasome activator complex subunit 3 [Gregarina niphandrodes]|uniref:Proteasome activator complex subunit 3 n=1 Tax=Gregarina niphandrodes TaxID=110365 RepID=A0A023B2J4_GRENI|nr:proteasome activator complex subunit 3 [Gregarina niphandrodes]EZG54456.1 proteasome activator complex subunit 3 [Gregarina niphandrodes]|eukprot:XP_011131843.1 proteasome activator complex subunit 3 [Gregarina niphandrodes]